ncbi:MAG: methyltransferase domain-containing protein [Alphaproteobacteria bacterium]|nr:methyltransferase domain-containing protein [Alphaproteobacteria bacterium]
MTSVDLKEFYDSSQGLIVKRLLRQHIRRFWPDVAARRVLGIGYALPYLNAFLQEAERVAALMPAQMGAVHWPQNTDGLTCVYGAAGLPIETNSVDMVVAVHAFQNDEAAQALLSECWRVLSGQGRLLLIVPNRTGIWARTDSTPFGHGAPYSMQQVRRLLKDHLFAPERAERALFVPPSASRLMLAAAPVWERLGQRFFNAFGGVNIIEATKQLYAGLPVAVQQRAAAVPNKVLPVGAPYSGR